MTHEIHLRGYTARPARPSGHGGPALLLGTRGSYGTQQLKLLPGPEWQGLTLTATFYAPGSNQPVRVLADSAGVIPVPPEATASSSLTRPGQIVFAGLAEGVQRISCNLAYQVADHAPAEGPEGKATPTVIDQALAQMGQQLAAAEEAAKAAEEVAVNTPQLSASDTWLVWDSEAGAYRDSGLYAGGRQPEIGANGNWYVAGQDTGVRAAGQDGKDGADGQNGADGYTPVKGVDYLTPAEVEALTAEVKAAARPLAEEVVAAHDAADTAHPALLDEMQALSARVFAIEANGGGGIAQNQFEVYLDSLEGLDASGVWTNARLEF